MRRRSKGEGGLTKRATGHWQATYVGSDGQRHYLYAVTRREAAEKLTAALRDKALGIYVAGSSQTLSQFLAAYLADAAGRLRPSTLERYAGQVRLHVVPHLGDLPLRKLTPQHLSALYGRLALSLAPASIVHLHRILHSALEQAALWRLILLNPTDAVRPPKARRREMVVLSIVQAQQLLAAVAGDPLEALYVVALHTGMRQGELLALRWRDLEGSRADVNATLVRTAGQWRRGPTKTGARRSIALDSSALESLRAQRIREVEKHLALGSPPTPDTLIFTDQWGDPINGSHITERHLKPLLRRIGLPAIRFHDLRHGFASLALSQGIRVDLVAQMLGHRSPAMTLAIYAHLMPGDQEEAARRIDAALSS